MRATLNVLRTRPPEKRPPHPPLDAADLLQCATQHGRQFLQNGKAIDWNLFTQCFRFTQAWWGQDAARTLYRRTRDNLGCPPPNPFDPPVPRKQDTYHAGLPGSRQWKDYAIQQREDEDRLSWGDPLYYPAIVRVDNKADAKDAPQSAMPLDVLRRGRADAYIHDYILADEFRDDTEMWLDTGDCITGPPEHTRAELETLRDECARAHRDLQRLKPRDFEYGFQRAYVDHLKSYVTDLYGDTIYDLFIFPDPDRPDPIDTARSLRQYAENDRMEGRIFENGRKVQLPGNHLHLHPPGEDPYYDHTTSLTGIRVARRARDTVSYTPLTEVHLLNMEDGHATSYDRTLGLRDDIASSRKIRRARRPETRLDRLVCTYQWANAVSPRMTLHDVVTVVHLGRWTHQESPIEQKLTTTFGPEASNALIDYAMGQPWSCPIA
jgi:hypothetical protein